MIASNAMRVFRYASLVVLVVAAGACSAEGRGNGRQAKAKLDAPANVTPGQEVVITFTVTGGNPVKGALFAVGGEASVEDGPGPFSLRYHVPDRYTGVIEVHADTFGGQPNDYSASTTMRSQPAESPTAITVEPPELEFNHVGEGYNLRVGAVLPGGTTIDVTDDGSVSYAMVGEAGVVSVTREQVEALGPGRVIIRVTYGRPPHTLSKDVPIAVSITNHAPQLRELSDVSMLVGETRDLPLIATDEEGDDITISGTYLKPFATVIDNGGGKGILRLRPSEGDEGSYRLAVAAADNGRPPFGDVRTINISIGSRSEEPKSGVSSATASTRKK